MTAPPYPWTFTPLLFALGACSLAPGDSSEFESSTAADGEDSATGGRNGSEEADTSNSPSAGSSASEPDTTLDSGGANSRGADGPGSDTSNDGGPSEDGSGTSAASVESGDVGASEAGSDEGIEDDGDCNTPPPLGPVIGWAGVSGNDTATTTGGGEATPISVSTLAQLQAAASGTTPAVIHVTGALNPGNLTIGSNKTIVGLCDAEIHGHVELSESVNVIIHNIAIVGFGVGDCSLDPDFDPGEGCSSGVDAISVQRNSHHVWFDHCDVSDGTDGNLDITNGADFVTVSWTRFHYTPRTDDVGGDSTGEAGHRFSNLVGGTDDPDDFDDANALNVTWHHNWWADNVVERQPRIRFGQNHLFNNLYTSDTTNYCVRAGINANVLLEGNVFDGVDTPHEFNDEDDEATAHITADDSNEYIGTTGERAIGGGGTPFTDPPYDYTVESTASARAAVVADVGPR